jgi:peptidoglycan/LPS O-acetylase OafA/YrhL
MVHYSMSAPKRLLELDALRGIAALSVVFFHYTTHYEYGQSDKLWFNFPYGLYGINLFFLISGFVIFLTLTRVNNGLDFVVARFSRLYPAYWIAGAITFFVVLYAGLPGREVSLKDALVNITMLEYWFHVPYVDGSYWTLSYELAFYVIMLIFFLTKLLKKIDFIALIWLSIMILVKVVERYFGFDLPDILKVTFLLNFGNLFIAGIMFYKIKNKESSLLTHIIIAVCLIIDPLFYRVFHRIPEAIIITGFFIIFYLFAYDKLSIIIKRPLLFLGAISYPLYLIHGNIGYIIMRNLYSTNLNPQIIILITVIMVAFLAWVIHITVENPMMKGIRIKYKEFQQQRYPMATSLIVGEILHDSQQASSPQSPGNSTSTVSSSS